MASTENTAIDAMHRALKEAREAKKSLESRLVELETEGAMLRSQVSSLNTVIEQASSALRSALFPAEESIPPAPVYPGRPTPTQAAEAARPLVRPQQPPIYPVDTRQAAIELEDLETIDSGASSHAIGTTGNVRFNDFRIPQAATVVLREAGGPLHVSEIYQRMAEGGFEFRGQHQLITLAVSLSRAKRFRKVAPGTFELDQRFATGQVA